MKSEVTTKLEADAFKLSEVLIHQSHYLKPFKGNTFGEHRFPVTSLIKPTAATLAMDFDQRLVGVSGRWGKRWKESQIGT